MEFECAAIIGQANDLLYLRALKRDSDLLNYHFIVHTALDVIEEKRRAAAKGSQSNDSYLGLLYSTVEYSIYGYSALTHIKFVAVVSKNDGMAQEDEVTIKTFFKNLHQLYIRVCYNPFYFPGEAIRSEKIDEEMDELMSRYSPTTPRSA
eukprot:Clim_evm98s156 gene=Clim_evmTU98s156